MTGVFRADGALFFHPLPSPYRIRDTRPGYLGYDASLPRLQPSAPQTYGMVGGPISGNAKVLSLTAALIPTGSNGMHLFILPSCSNSSRLQPFSRSGRATLLGRRPLLV